MIPSTELNISIDSFFDVSLELLTAYLKIFPDVCCSVECIVVSLNRILSQYLQLIRRKKKHIKRNINLNIPVESIN
jgi:hypothetical protein